MGFKDTIKQKTTQMFFDKNKDRLTQVQGKVLSIKTEEKTFLWLIHKLTVTILVKPENSRNIVTCIYKKKRWFKKVEFMSILQGNSVLVQGLKSRNNKDNKDFIEVINIRNNNTKKFLHPVEGAEDIKIQKARPNRKLR